MDPTNSTSSTTGRFAALWIGIASGAAGAAAAFLLLSARDSGSSGGADEAALRGLRDEVAALSAKMDRLAPPPGLAPAPRPAADPASTPTTASPSGRPGTPPGETALEEIATRAARAVLAEQAAKTEAAKPKPKKRVPLAEASRELGLTSGQEAEVRAAYAEATDKFLALMAQPDGDVETIRRELDEARGNQAKRTGLMVKYLPKIMPKIGEMMAIQADRDARIERVLGPDLTPKYKAYDVEEEDAFGLRGNVKMDVGDVSDR